MRRVDFPIGGKCILRMYVKSVYIYGHNFISATISWMRYYFFFLFAIFLYEILDFTLSIYLSQSLSIYLIPESRSCKIYF